MAVKHLDGRGLSWVKDVPVIDGAVCDQSQCRLADPLPEGHVLAHRRRLELLLLFEVEDLEGARLGLEGDDLTRPVHDGTVGLDGSSDDIVVVLEVDDQDLGRRRVILLVPDADERV